MPPRLMVALLYATPRVTHHMLLLACRRQQRTLLLFSAPCCCFDAMLMLADAAMRHAICFFTARYTPPRCRGLLFVDAAAVPPHPVTMRNYFSL